MGNDQGRFGERSEVANMSWKDRTPQNRQFEALAMVLPRSPSYLGLVAFNLRKDRVKEMSSICTKLITKTNQECTGEQLKQIQALTKFTLLLEWRKETVAPTCGKLEQQLWQAGYDSPAYEEILKKRWSLQSLPHSSNQTGPVKGKSLLFTYLEIDLQQINQLLGKLKLHTKPAEPSKNNEPTSNIQKSNLKRTKASKTFPSSSGAQLRGNSHPKLRQFKYVEVADVATQTVEFEEIENCQNDIPANQDLNC